MLDHLVALAAGALQRTEPVRLFTEMGRHPRLFRAWLPFAATLLLLGDLPGRDTELVVLRTARNASSDYEWLQHRDLAARRGLRAEVIEALTEDGAASDDRLSERQQALVAAVDELHAGRTLTDPAKARLERHLGERQVLELCVLVGHYELLAMVLNTRRCEPEPSLLRREGVVPT